MKLTGDKIIGIILIAIPFTFVLYNSIKSSGIMKTVEVVGFSVFIITFVVIGMFFLTHKK